MAFLFWTAMTFQTNTNHSSSPEREIKKSVAIHFGTYQLSLEDGLRQGEDFQDALDTLGVSGNEFLLPTFGKLETI